MGGGALGACEQESEGSVPGEVRHSLGGAKLTLSPSPWAASKGARAETHGSLSCCQTAAASRTHAHTQYACTCAISIVCMCGRLQSVTCFLFLCAVKLTRRNATSPAEADDRLEATSDSVGKGEKCKCVSSTYLRAGGPL